ncbi:MAG TPA: MerR family transcriptional regulator [Anaerolineae bacterium]|nr:MerR family transcriptional regulator [Anaerolineae bacterium]HNU03672.1 MerR family transcriptional regulator [Anaerolineae bacterium]
MKIAEVSEKYGISTDTLRYYERVGLIPPVPRNGSGIRDYGDTEAKRIEFVKCMRNAGLPIEVLIEYFDLAQQGDATLAARKALLTEQRDLLLARIAELQATLDLLNYKIEVHVNALLKNEREIAWVED